MSNKNIPTQKTALGIIGGSFAAALVLTLGIVIGDPHDPVPHRGRSPEATNRVVICEAPGWVTPKLIHKISKAKPFPPFTVISRRRCPSPKSSTDITISGISLSEMRAINARDNTPDSFAHTIVYPKEGPVTGGFIQVMSMADMRDHGITSRTDKWLAKRILGHEVAHALGFGHVEDGTRHLMTRTVDLLSWRRSRMVIGDTPNESFLKPE